MKIILNFIVFHAPVYCQVEWHLTKQGITTMTVIGKKPEFADDRYCCKMSENESDVNNKDLEQLRTTWPETSSSDGGRPGSSTENDKLSSQSEVENKSSDDNTPTSYSASASSMDNSSSDGGQSDEQDGSNEKTRRERDEGFSTEIRDMPLTKRSKQGKSKSHNISQQRIRFRNENQYSTQDESEESQGQDEEEYYSFKEQLSSLREENGHLMQISMSRNDPFPFADRIMGDCDVRLPEVVASAVQLLISRIEKAEVSTLHLKDQQIKKCFCITNASTTVNAIVYTSRSFLHLTGYSPIEVLGKPCTFLKGPGTDPLHIQRIDEAFATGNEVKLVMRCYTSKGVVFWSDFQMSPLRDSSGKVLLFLIIQTETHLQPDTPDRSMAANELSGFNFSDSGHDASASTSTSLST
eukprot:gene6162-12477_t